MNLRESVARAIDAQAENMRIELHKIMLGREVPRGQKESDDGWTVHCAVADAAILAMFNHLAANVSEEAIRAGIDAGFRGPDVVRQHRAMIEQAKREYDETKG